MKAKYPSLLRFGISLALVFFLLWIMRGKYTDIASKLKNTNPILFFLANGRTPRCVLEP